MEFTTNTTSTKCIITFTVIFLFTITAPLGAQESNRSNPDLNEQVNDALKKLRARAKTVRIQAGTALRNTKARHKHQRADATSTDPQEVQRAKEKLALMREGINILSKIPHDTFNVPQASGHKALFLIVSHEGRIKLAFTKEHLLSVSPRNKLLLPSAAKNADRHNDELHRLSMQLFLTGNNSLLGLDKNKSLKGAFMIVNSPQGESELAIRILGDRVIARKKPSKDNDGILEVRFPYSKMRYGLKQAERDLRNVQHKKVPTNLQNRQQEELQELKSVNRMVGNLDKQLIKAPRALKAVADNNEQFNEQMSYFNQLVDESQTAINEELKRIERKYERRTLTNTVGMKFVKVPEGYYVLCSGTDDKPQLTMVSQIQWTRVMGDKNNPSRNNGLDLPVENISEQDKIRFCKKLSRKEGRRYRLPNEDEQKYIPETSHKKSFHTSESGAKSRAGHSTIGRGVPTQRRSTQQTGSRSKLHRIGTDSMHNSSGFTVILEAD
jgi:RNA polymerase-binding transcription factor DksA